MHLKLTILRGLSSIPDCLDRDENILKDKNIQERLRQQAIKDAEKERAQFYAKQKEGQKDVRAKYREKVNVVSYKKALGRHLKCYSIR